MGVEVIVNYTIENINGKEKITSFDETIKKINYEIIDFRSFGMKWFFYNYNGDYLCQISMLKSDIVNPDKFISGSEMMIHEISEILNLKLSADPIVARKTIKQILLDNKNELENVINQLQNMFICNEFDKAWSFIKETQCKLVDPKTNNELEQIISDLHKFNKNNDTNKAWSYIANINKHNNYTCNNIIAKIESVMKYVELAVFFYTAGKNGHRIEWSY